MPRYAYTIDTVGTVVAVNIPYTVGYVIYHGIPTYTVGKPRESRYPSVPRCAYTEPLSICGGEQQAGVGGVRMCFPSYMPYTSAYSGQLDAVKIHDTEAS